jgi:hypothetical protein
MWLLNTSTLRLHEFQSDPPHYAILSHTWENEEVIFQDIGTFAAERKTGYEKIRRFCAQSKKDGLQYAWVDTCCIDKRNFAELSEAINSMFRWYSEAYICYVYLADVHSKETTPALEHSRYFTRGWTLQELLAPSEVVFFNSHWQTLGTKLTLLMELSHITLVPPLVLLHREEIFTASIAQRMSWVSSRETTRIEDRAYSLLGIFQISMPILYGEGIRAFHRLQLEILTGPHDQSIFAWTPIHRGEWTTMLAPSPSCFAPSGDIQTGIQSRRPSQMTSLGLSMRMPILIRQPPGLPIGQPLDKSPGRKSTPQPSVQQRPPQIFALLDCLLFRPDGVSRLVGIPLCEINSKDAGLVYGRDLSKGGAWKIIEPAEVDAARLTDVILAVDSLRWDTPRYNLVPLLVSISLEDDARHLRMLYSQRYNASNPDLDATEKTPSTYVPATAGDAGNVEVSLTGEGKWCACIFECKTETAELVRFLMVFGKWYDRVWSRFRILDIGGRNMAIGNPSVIMNNMAVPMWVTTVQELADPVVSLPFFKDRSNKISPGTSIFLQVIRIIEPSKSSRYLFQLGIEYQQQHVAESTLMRQFDDVLSLYQP